MTDFRYFRADPSKAAQHSLHASAADHSGFLLSDAGRGDARNPYLNDAVLAERLSAESADVLAFFDKHLDGRDSGPAKAAARWQVANGLWHSSNEWPPTDVQDRDLYLEAGGEGVIGRLSPKATGRHKVRWFHDPGSPVRSTTSIEEIWYFVASFPDERDLADRGDVLTFTTDVLEMPVEIAGRPSVTLALATTGPSMHLFGTLQDVSPDGTTRPVSHGRRPIFEPDPSSPTRLELGNIAYRFDVGQRVQLQVKSSDYPWYLAHPGTDDNPWFTSTFITTEQTLICGGITPSRLTLPILSD